MWDEAGERKHRSSLGLERAGERHCGQKDLPGITRGTKGTLWGQMEVRSGEFGAKSEFIYREKVGDISEGKAEVMSSPTLAQVVFAQSGTRGEGQSKANPVPPLNSRISFTSCQMRE